MARKRRGRPIDGILILDKPTGLTSNASLQTAKRLYFAAKAGHTGNLDPLATGVLPICFGEATKFSQYLLDSDKVYESTFVLGVTTTSGDSDGDVIESQPVSITEQEVHQALMTFSGEIDQVPSMFSALKHEGQPLYKLARAGKEVERKSRRVTIYEIRLEAFRSAEQTDSGQPEVDVFVDCSKGTYIRSIAEDLGAALGCGAHLSRLRRTKAGPFAINDSISLPALEALKQSESYEQMDSLLKPVDSALTDMPAVMLGESAEYYIRQGQAVLIPKSPTEGMVRLLAEDRRFLGIGSVLDDGRVTPKRLIASGQLN